MPIFDPVIFDPFIFDEGTGRRILVNGVEMSSRVDLSTFTPLNSNLAEIPSAHFVVEDPNKTLPATQVPRLFHSVEVYGEDGSLEFGGYINTLTERSDKGNPIGRSWRLDCQGYGARALETATGSLNKLGLIDSDRNFVIDIFEDALLGQSFGGATVDDAIIAANVGWPGVAHTAFISGHDWSYSTPSAAMRLLTRFVPNVYWSFGADRVLTYGLSRDLAPFAMHSSPNGTTLRGFSNYQEEEVISDHRNKMRRGGFDTAEVTAIDEVSWAKFQRILDSPYEDDETIPAADLARRTYAELRRHRTRRRVNFSTDHRGLQAGQLVDVVNTRIGPGTRPGPMLQIGTLIARSESGAIAGERGRLRITKVTTRPMGNQTYSYEVEAGDVVTDFPLQIPASTE